MKHWQHTALLLVLITIICVSQSVPTASAHDADSLHWAAWDHVLAATADYEAARYAAYAYRTLAVPHPEIYLQGDAIFAQIIETMPGSRAAARGADARDVELFRSLLSGEHEGPSFTWRSWAPLPDSVYDRQEDGSSFLDRRVSPMAVILTAISPHLSTAEAALMRYTQLRRTGHPGASLFVVVDTAGAAYLAQDGTVLSAPTGRAWEGDASGIVPALVFNEKSVYYPLFGRDDRDQDQNLAQLVGTLAAAGSPQLTADDQTRIDRLRTVAALDTKQQHALAKLAAFGAAGTENPVVRAAWERAIGTEAVAQTGCVKGMIRLIIYWADYLSPKTAELAALTPGLEFESDAGVWQDAYLEWCGRRVKPRDSTDSTVEAGGYLWAYELIDVTFDDIIRTRSGPPSSQALVMAAALDLLGVPNTRLDFDSGESARPDQHWILTEQGRWQFNLGVWTKVNMEIELRDRIPLFIGSYGITGRWTNVRPPFYLTNSDAATIQEDLPRIVSMMPYARLSLRPQFKSIMSLQQLMLELSDNGVSWSSLPWPRASAESTNEGDGSQ
jgi:hypothetical protein